MNTLKTKRNLLALTAVTLLSLGASVTANAQSRTLPTFDPRALDATTAVAPAEGRPSFVALAAPNRSSTLAGNTENEDAAGVSASMSRH